MHLLSARILLSRGIFDCQWVSGWILFSHSEQKFYHRLRAMPSRKLLPHRINTTIGMSGWNLFCKKQPASEIQLHRMQTGSILQCWIHRRSIVPTRNIFSDSRSALEIILSTLPCGIVLCQLWNECTNPMYCWNIFFSIDGVLLQHMRDLSSWILLLSRSFHSDFVFYRKLLLLPHQWSSFIICLLCVSRRQRLFVIKGNSMLEGHIPAC